MMRGSLPFVRLACQKFYTGQYLYTCHQILQYLSLSQVLLICIIFTPLSAVVALTLTDSHKVSRMQNLFVVVV